MAKLIVDRTASPVTPIEHATTTSNIPSYNGVSYDMMQYLGFTPLDLDNETSKKVMEVSEYFKGDTLKISEVERKLGVGSERMIDKLWRYATLHKQIENLEKQRANLYG